mmetsp:Transcript_3815/g.8268  ORF Transcript_3815/g.8268 Transcript_3815/m.8268 type:complete len:220 (-) Transcript_3815:436-1095(-)
MLRAHTRHGCLAGEEVSMGKRKVSLLSPKLMATMETDIGPTIIITTTNNKQTTNKQWHCQDDGTVPSDGATRSNELSFWGTCRRLPKGPTHNQGQWMDSIVPAMDHDKRPRLSWSLTTTTTTTTTHHQQHRHRSSSSQSSSQLSKSVMERRNPHWSLASVVAVVVVCQWGHHHYQNNNGRRAKTRPTTANAASRKEGWIPPGTNHPCRHLDSRLLQHRP